MFKGKFLPGLSSIRCLMYVLLLATFFFGATAWSMTVLQVTPETVRYQLGHTPETNVRLNPFASHIRCVNFRNGHLRRSCAVASKGEDEESESIVADNGDNLLAGRALQALEFWQHQKPSPELQPSEVVALLMAALQKNDEPEKDDGLRTVFEFSSGMCRRAVGGTVDRFLKEARFSVFAANVGCQSFSLSPLQTVGDRLATQVVNVVAADGRKRRFLWTLERQRRPPDTNKWLIYGVVSSDVNGKLTMEG